MEVLWFREIKIWPYYWDNEWESFLFYLLWTSDTPNVELLAKEQGSPAFCQHLGQLLAVHHSLLLEDSKEMFSRWNVQEKWFTTYVNIQAGKTVVLRFVKARQVRLVHMPHLISYMSISNRNVTLPTAQCSWGYCVESSSKHVPNTCWRNSAQGREFLFCPIQTNVVPGESKTRSTKWRKHNNIDCLHHYQGH